jgi:N utilization substance protein B
MGQRRLARERAVQILYSIDRTGQDLTEALVAYIEMQDDQRRSPLHHFTVELLEAALEHQADLDRRLTEVIANWQPERVAAVDRQVLRLAVCELLYFPEIPSKVTLNEYIEVAKTFSGTEAAPFINGVLDRIAHTLPPKPSDTPGGASDE